MNMISDSIPTDWHDLEAQVNKILEECGLSVEIHKDIETVRGTVNIDVYAEDTTQKPPTVYLCECKHWNSSVPQSVVHAFRTVVSDFGANWGLLISSRTFQRGAYEAAKNSNVKLLNWFEFQELFIDRWIQDYMLPRIYQESDALVDYTEPINSRIFRKADALDPELQEQFIALRPQYEALAFFALHISIPILIPGEGIWRRLPDLPMKKDVKPEHYTTEGSLPEDLIEATSLRQFLDTLSYHLKKGTAAFDDVFGERA